MVRVSTCLFVAALSCAAAYAPTQELTTLDESIEPLPCRILVPGSDDQCAAPEDAVTLQTGQDQWFMSLSYGGDRMVGTIRRINCHSPDLTVQTVSDSVGVDRNRPAAFTRRTPGTGAPSQSSETSPPP